MKTMKLRSAPTLLLNRDLRIDREHLVIRDVVAMQAGIEALGHGCQADITSLHMMQQLGNAQTRGIRSRFGHPGMSENAAGKKIAVAKNFRIDGDRLKHDMHLLDPARESPVFARDPIEYIFDMAERYPEELGESCVVDVDCVWTFADGTELPADDRSQWPEGIGRDEKGRPVNALTTLPVIRPQAFYYVDVVSEGALTHEGLFGAEVIATMFDGTASAYAQEVFELVDRWREDYGIALEEVPRKVNQFVSKYLYARGYKENEMTPTKKKFEEKPPLPAAQDAGAPVEPTESGGEPEDDGLDAALETAATTAERRTDSVEVDSEDAEPTKADLQARVEHLEVVVRQMGEQMTKLTRLSIVNTENIEALDRNVRRIDGDPVVTLSVPRQRASALEPMQFGAPVPPAVALASRPTHVSERPLNGSARGTPAREEDSEAQASLEASRRRRGGARR